MKVLNRPSFALLLAAALLAFSARAQEPILAQGAPMPPPADAAQQRAKAQRQVEQGELNAAEQDRLHEQRPSALNTSEPPSEVPPPTIPPEEHAPTVEATHAATPLPHAPASSAKKSRPQRAARKLPAHPLVPAHAQAPANAQHHPPLPPDRSAARGPDPDR